MVRGDIAVWIGPDEEATRPIFSPSHRFREARPSFPASSTRIAIHDDVPKLLGYDVPLASSHPEGTSRGGETRRSNSFTRLSLVGTLMAEK